MEVKHMTIKRYVLTKSKKVLLIININKHTWIKLFKGFLQNKKKEKLYNKYKIKNIKIKLEYIA